MSPFPPEDLRPLSPDEVAAAGLDAWRLADDRLHVRFVTDSFAHGLAILSRIGEEADRVDHHPDVELSYGSLTVHLSSHDVAAVTARDLRLARTIDEIASAHGATPTPT